MQAAEETMAFMQDFNDTHVSELRKKLSVPDDWRYRRDSFSPEWSRLFLELMGDDLKLVCSSYAKGTDGERAIAHTYFLKWPRSPECQARIKEWRADTQHIRKTEADD